MWIGQKEWVIDSIPVTLGMDTQFPPGALSILDPGSNNNYARYRDFSGSVSNELVFEWPCPEEMDLNMGVYYQWEGWITSATPPANGQDIQMILQAVAFGDRDKLGLGNMGTFAWNNLTFSVGVVNSIGPIAVPGTNYQVGDLLTVNGGGNNATFRVDNIDGNGGVVLPVTILNGGTGYTTNSGYTASGGHGAGVIFRVVASTVPQYSRMVSPWSTEILDITNLGFTANELVLFLLRRYAEGDTYNQPFGIGWLKIKYAKKTKNVRN
jgi:hypothetical protein